ncbi:uncharacterized protein M421DRAFT_425462 [Didymella exigua CBS 183.55]|uniref:MARVEL domain-containing protein n=1 Tax=Didymella exigua CBS 183.55 TaxID=1150837 RepID=A0A6A5RDG8_9PLEO|nr:uncharacterized protein M421DRAFT_425462 [Didymella exigua CBS 183.55]KAF1923757.1 hypothetical protein M421DRAFT_425462 [Didymella exigua CBS 183.55]
MIFTRLLSLILRFAQFVFAAVVLGLTSYFMYQRTRNSVGPFGRTVFAIVWSSLSILFSIIWMIPTKSTMASYGSDLVFTAGWAAVFALLVIWFNGADCGSAWAWGGISLSRSNYCGQWKAAQAFSFLSLVFWFTTFVLGVITYHRLTRQPVINEGPGKSFGGRRSRV